MIDYGFWLYVLVISSVVGVELWKDIVMRFIVVELSVRSEGIVGIRVLYVFIGGMSYFFCE